MESTAGADPDDHTASNESCHAVTADNELVKQLNANLFALQQYKDAAASHTRKAAMGLQCSLRWSLPLAHRFGSRRGYLRAA